jgi:hypothetical protein
MSARFEILKGGWEDLWPHLRLEGDSAIGRTEIDKEAKVSEDGKHDETEVEAHHHGGRHVDRNDEGSDVEAHHHGGRHVDRNDEPADEQRRADGDHSDDDEVEAHMRRTAHPGRQVG